MVAIMDEEKKDLNNVDKVSDADSKQESSDVIKQEKKENIFLTIFYALLIALFIRSFFYEPFHIPSGSMKPNLIEGDFILVSKFEYGYSRYSFPFGLPLFKGRFFDFNKPERGDVVVFRLPSNPRINYIKRLIGLPGDKIIVKNNVLYINGEEIKSEYIDQYYDEANSIYLLKYKEDFFGKGIDVLHAKGYRNPDGDGEFVVPDGFYFFMGDNRDNSLDSRFAETGFIPYENIVGKAKIIFFSKSDSLFKFWKIFGIIRYNRIFKIIE